MKQPLSDNSRSTQFFGAVAPLLRLVTIVFGIATAYFLTIQSLKLELAGKAENQAVATIDKKLTNIEVILKEGVLDKEEFYIFSKEVEKRLTRIESLLASKDGR